MWKMLLAAALPAGLCLAAAVAAVAAVDPPSAQPPAGAGTAAGGAGAASATATGSAPTGTAASGAPATGSAAGGTPTDNTPATGTGATGTTATGTTATGTAATGTTATGTTATGTAPPAKGKAQKGKTQKGAAASKPAAPVKPAPPPPKPPVPNPALGQLKSLAGDWTCTGRTYGPGPDHTTAGTLSFAWALDGFWLEGRYEELKGDARNPVPVSWRMLLGYEELQQQLTASTFDNITGAATLYATTGWQAEKLVYEGMAHRATLQFQTRESFVRKGDDQLLHLQEANVAENWIKLHEDTCKRSAAK